MITLVITDSYDGQTDYIVPRSQRKGLYTTTQVPGGDFESGVMIPCAILSNWGRLPSLGSRYALYDPDIDPNNPFWIGVLTEHNLMAKKRVITGISLVAHGYYITTEWQNFKVNQVYGPSTSPTNSILDDKFVITDISDAIKNAVTQLDQYVTVDNDYIAQTGITVRVDSQAFAGNGAEAVLNWAAGTSTYLANPFIWQFYAIAGEPTLVFASMETQAYYLDDGLTEWGAKYALQPIVNEVTVEWGTRQRWTEPYDSGGSLSGPLKYVPFGGVNLIRNKYVNVGEDYFAIDDVKALAAGYLQKFNQIQPEGNITLEQPIRVVGNLSAAIHIVRAGKVIRTELPDNWPYEDVEKYIVSTRWEEDTCKTTVNFGTLSGISQDMRRLILLPNQGITWATAFGGQSVPAIDLRKVKAFGTVHVDLPDQSQPKIAPIFPTGIFSDDDHSYSGTETDVGGTLIPEIIPKRYFNFNQQIQMGDGSVVAIGDNAAGLFSENFLMKGWYIKTLKPLATNATLSVRIKVNGVAVPGATATLTAAQTNTGTITPFQVAAGDFISFDVLTNDVSIFIIVTPYGQQDYPEYPHYGPPAP